MPLPVGAVLQLEPVQNWPFVLRSSLQRLDRSEPPNTDPRRLPVEARAIAESIAQHSR